MKSISSPVAVTAKNGTTSVGLVHFGSCPPNAWRPYEMRRRAPLAISFLVVASWPVFAQLSIPRPNFGVPEFAQPSGTFRAEIKADAGLTNALWTVVLINDLRSWTGAVEQVDYGAFVDNDTDTGYRLTIRVPSDISPEVFKIVISHPDGGAATNWNAVGIVQNFETNFYILHYADPQAGGYEPTKPDTGMCGNNGSIREIYWHAPAFSLIHPRLMFDTGDELDNPYYAYSVANYQQYIDAMCQIGVPVLVTRGNNDDMISTAEWRSTLGVETYSLAMGSFYVCQKDYNEDNFTTWFTNDYAASFTNPAIQFRLFGQHFSDAQCSWLPPAGQEPGLMLVGHIHINSIVQSNPYYILSTAAAHNKGAVSLIEFARTGTNWICTSLNDISGAQFQVMNSGAEARVSNTFAYLNDGTSLTNTATIVNDIPNNFWDGRVRFLMPYSAAGYTVSNGVKLAEYPYNDNSNMAVVVKVNIAQSATTRVGIRPCAAHQATNGTPYWWLAQHGLAANDTGELYDEGDGVPAWQEYVADTDPTNAASFFRISGATNLPPWTIYFDSSSNRLYGVLWCSNLVEGIWTNIPGLESRQGAGGPDQMQITNGKPSRFHRLNVALP